MKTTLCLAATALVFAASANAAGPPVAWSTKDMKTAIRALGYPKPHAKKLACKGLGPADTTGRHTSFRCTATYKHHVHRRFVIGGDGEGGWLCAGKTVTGCKMLRHGFVTTSEVSVEGIGAAADLAARGYATDKWGSYQATSLCKQTSSLAWSCGFTAGTVTITMKTAKGGYLISASAAT